MITKKSPVKHWLEIAAAICAVLSFGYFLYDRNVGKSERQNLDRDSVGESSTPGGWEYPTFASTTVGWNYPSYYSPSTSYFDNVTTTYDYYDGGSTAFYYASPGSSFENFTATPSQKPTRKPQRK